MKKALTRNRAPASPARSRQKLAELFETDEVAWLEKSAKLLRQQRFEKLDHLNLAEYLDDMAIRDRREVKSRLTTLFHHLLKWQFQPQFRSGSWEATIFTQRGELSDILTQKTLKNHALAIVHESFARALKIASKVTGIAISKFPKECPYSLDNLLSDNLPEGDE